MAANWPFGLLLLLIFSAIKNLCSEKKRNLFSLKSHLLFYGQFKKIPFGPNSSRLAVWAIIASDFFGPSKNNTWEIKVIHFYKKSLVILWSNPSLKPKIGRSYTTVC